MTYTTKAAVLRAPDAPFTLEEVELEPLRGHEILVRIVGSGFCHSDLMPRQPSLTGGELGPIIMGHEGAGIVEEVGSEVTTIAVGDRVVLSFDSCGHCASCRTGHPSYCPEFGLRNLSGRNADLSSSARDADGHPILNRWFAQSSFAEYAVATDRNAVVVDDSVPLELLGPLGCGVQTGAGSVLNVLQPQPGQSIVIFGIGGVGLSGLLAAKLSGASDIVAVDLVDSRLELALELGATRAVRGDAPDLVAQITGGGRGLDLALDTTAAPPVMSTALQSVGTGGKVVFVGVGTGQFTAHPTALTGKTLTYAIEGASVPQLFIPRLIDLYQRGLFPYDRLITRYAFDEINQAEADTASGKAIKPLLLPA